MDFLDSGGHKIMKTSFRAAGIILSVVLLVLAGCGGGTEKAGSAGGNKLDGVYHSANGGPITITIKDGKATVQIANETKTLDYKVEGNKLTILNPQEGNVLFTINDDGTLTGELGLMSKKP
jgi:hypothetical protein